MQQGSCNNVIDGQLKFATENKAHLLFLIFFLAHLFVFMPMFARHGYRWDEILDFTGAATDTYVANGRWMQAILRIILGEGVHPWTSPILACVVLSATSVMQCMIFRWGSFYHSMAYGIAAVILYQYAFVMQYAHQSDTIAIGMLLSTIAVQYLIEKGFSWKTLVGILFIGLAISIYQSLGLYVVALLLIWGILECSRGEGRKAYGVAIKSIGAIMIALAMWKIGKECSLMFISEETKECYEYAQTSMANSSGILEAPLGYTLHYMLLTIKHCVIPEFKMEWLYGLTALPVLLIIIATFRLQNTKILKLAIIVGALALWILPFTMILALGNEWPCKPHTRIAEPIAFAGLWSIAGVMYANCLTCYKYRQAIVFIAMLLLLVRASGSVADIAATERALFESRVFNIKQMIREADAFVEKNKLPAKHDKYVFFNSTTKYEYGSVDFTSSYPVWHRIRTAQKSDYKKHKEAVEEMPCWPNAGSIREDKGELIIKGNDFGGTQEMSYL